MQHKGEVFESELEELQKDTQALASKTQLRYKGWSSPKGLADVRQLQRSKGS